MTREISSTTLRRRRGERGASAVEYALIIAGAGLALVGGVVVLGQGVRTAFIASAQGAESGATGAQDTSSGDYSPPVVDPGPTTEPSSTPSSLPTSTPAPIATQVATPTPTPTATKTGATPTPSPTQTRPKDAISVESGEDAKPVDVGVPNGARGFTATVDPEWAGDAYLDGDDELIFDASKQVDAGTLVTVSWSYSKGGKLYTGATRYWIT